MYLLTCRLFPQIGNICLLYSPFDIYGYLRKFRIFEINLLFLIDQIVKWRHIMVQYRTNLGFFPFWNLVQKKVASFEFKLWVFHPKFARLWEGGIDIIVNIKLINFNYLSLILETTSFPYHYYPHVFIHLNAQFFYFQSN